MWRSDYPCHGTSSYGDCFQAEGLVLSLRDLFQVVFEMKKREVELQKQKKQDGETTSESSPATSVKTSESKEKETVYDVSIFGIGIKSFNWKLIS